MVVTPNMLGLPIKRGEDPRLVSGSGAYLEDLVLPGLVHLAFARSPHAHARLTGIDVSAAREMPGVLAIFTAADADAVLPVDLPGDWPPFGEGDHQPPNKILARDKVRFVGEAIAAVVATSRAEAFDAIDTIEID